MRELASLTPIGEEDELCAKVYVQGLDKSWYVRSVIAGRPGWLHAQLATRLAFLPDLRRRGRPLSEVSP